MDHMDTSELSVAIRRYSKLVLIQKHELTLNWLQLQASRIVKLSRSNSRYSLVIKVHRRPRNDQLFYMTAYF